MYKLLVTTALVAMTATSASAWTGAKDLISDLDKVYNNLDGGTKFDTLQSTGELNTFVESVATGVTHLTLQVDSNNLITAKVNEGTTLDTIQTNAGNLVNRVNYDIFVETADTTYDVNGNYTGVDIAFTPVVTWDATDPDAEPVNGNGDGEFQVDDVYDRVDTNNGLLGVKVDKLVDDVNLINEGLLSTSTDSTERDGFAAAYAAGSGTINTVDIGEFQTNIDQLNSVGQILGGGTAGINSELNGIAVDASNVNNFYIPSYNAFNDIGIEATKPGGFVSLSDWANDLQTVTTTAGTGKIKTTEAIIIEADGTITVGGQTYTLNTTTKVFE